MQIIHRIEDFLFTIFPALAKDHSLAIPEGVDELGLNYKNEFEIAKTMLKEK